MILLLFFLIVISLLVGIANKTEDMLYQEVSENAIIVDLTNVTDQIQKEYSEYNLYGNGEDLYFQTEEIDQLIENQYIEDIYFTNVGMNSSTGFMADYEGKRLELMIDKDDFPESLKNITSYVRAPEEVYFSFKSSPVEYDGSEIYNPDYLEVLVGNFPADKSNQILIPDVMAQMIMQTSGTSSYQKLIGQTITLPISYTDQETEKTIDENKEYIISGIYNTNYQIKINDQYYIYTANQNKPQDKGEESYDTYLINSNYDDGLNDYYNGQLASYSNWLDAYGTGYQVMVVEVDDEKHINEISQILESYYPNIKLYSQYEIKNGEYKHIIAGVYIFNSLIILIITLITLFILFLLNINKNISDNKELSILYSFGYLKKDLRKIIFYQNIFEASINFIGAFISYLIFYGLFLSDTIFKLYFNSILTIDFYIIIMLYILILSSFISLLGIRRITKKKISKYLK